MKHKYNFYYDTMYPILRKLFGHKYDCCGKLLKNCKRCCKKNGYEYW